MRNQLRQIATALGITVLMGLYLLPAFFLGVWYTLNMMAP